MKKLKSYLPQVKTDIAEIIQAVESDPNVMVLAQYIKSEGEIIGSVSFALDMTQARQQEYINDSFDQLVDNKSDLVGFVLGKESMAINNELQTVVNNIRDITKKSSSKVGSITTMSNSLSTRTRNLLLIGSMLGFVLFL